MEAVEIQYARAAERCVKAGLGLRGRQGRALARLALNYLEKVGRRSLGNSSGPHHASGGAQAG